MGGVIYDSSNSCCPHNPIKDFSLNLNFARSTPPSHDRAASLQDEPSNKEMWVDLTHESSTMHCGLSQGRETERGAKYHLAAATNPPQDMAGAEQQLRRKARAAAAREPLPKYGADFKGALVQQKKATKLRHLVTPVFVMTASTG
jgi:hypothetical protein